MNDNSLQEDVTTENDGKTSDSKDLQGEKDDEILEDDDLTEEQKYDLKMRQNILRNRKRNKSEMNETDTQDANNEDKRANNDCSCVMKYLIDVYTKGFDKYPQRLSFIAINS